MVFIISLKVGASLQDADNEEESRVDISVHLLTCKQGENAVLEGIRNLFSNCQINKRRKSPADVNFEPSQHKQVTAIDVELLSFVFDNFQLLNV